MRFQAVLEDHRPHEEVLRSSLEKSMRRHGLRHQDSDGDAVVALIPTFGPFPEVPEAPRSSMSPRAGSTTSSHATTWV
jgi:2-haloacid dehalogenase